MMEKEVSWKGHQGPVIDTKDEFDVIECQSCGFRHVVPIPSEDELETIYRHEYYSTEKPLYLQRYTEDLAWWNLVYAERYETFEAQLPPTRRRILDIGSGPGFFVLHGKDRGWTAVGVEPSSQAHDHSESMGIDVRKAFFDEELLGTLGMFDVVHMSSVLEHLPNPANMLRLVHRVLDPGGILCATVPNDYSPFQHALREIGLAPWWVAPPHHLNYFDFDSLERLFVREGFQVLLRETTFPIDLFLLMGDNYIGDDALGRQCHGRRMQFEQNMASVGMGELKRRWYRACADLGIGREAVLFGRKG